jgi:peptide chain release factor
MVRLLQVSSGRGPNECCWVVSRLVQYLVAKAAKSTISAEIIEAVAGKRAGTFSSAMIRLEGGDEVEAFLAGWEGAVQWIGKSMYRPHHKRRNWFVRVKVIEPFSTLQWKREDVRVESMRSSGPGGQHANKTETAIRVTHIPTGLTAISQEERSQHANKRLALLRLENLFRESNAVGQRDFEVDCWMNHNSLERGNAVKVFSGKKFTLEK